MIQALTHFYYTRHAKRKFQRIGNRCDCSESSDEHKLKYTDWLNYEKICFDGKITQLCGSSGCKTGYDVVELVNNTIFKDCQ